MNEIARIEPQKAQRLSITEAMASNYSMAPDTFLATMRATVFAPNMSREEEAAFLLVAKHHNLNPITREIFAMKKQGGGIIPVVSIDGWVRMTNEHPAFDGMEFAATEEEVTCKIYRKDRSRPIAVTEYLAECRRQTQPWKEMPRRMLRHKAMIQCARYAFGFAGIYDPDEAERFAEPLTRQAPRPPAPSVAPQIEHRPAEAAAPTPRRAPVPPMAKTQPVAEPPKKSIVDAFSERAAAAQSLEELGEVWNDIVEPAWDAMSPYDQDACERANRHRCAELPNADDDGGEAGEP